jgi:hypothetical protein
MVYDISMIVVLVVIIEYDNISIIVVYTYVVCKYVKKTPNGMGFMGFMGFTCSRCESSRYFTDTVPSTPTVTDVVRIPLIVCIRKHIIRCHKKTSLRMTYDI